MRTLVRDEFAEIGFTINDNSILDKLVELLRLYNKRPSELANEWLAFSLKQTDASLSLETLELWEQKELRTFKGFQRETHVYTKKDIHSALDDDGLLASYGEGSQPISKRSGDGMKTPDQRATKYRRTGRGHTPAEFQSPSLFSQSFSVPPTPFTERSNAGEVCCELPNEADESLAALWEGTGASVRVSFATETEGKPTKYMFQKLLDKIAVLNDQIEEKEDQYVAKYQLEELDHVDMPKQETVTVVGRVCCDSEGKLNTQSILLEGSVKTSGGRSVHLDVADMKEYSLFSGQIVAVSGVNNSGGQSKLVALRLFTSVMEKPPPIEKETEGPLSVLIATGPFTTSSNLFYEPLDSLLSLVEREPPDVLILLGPFVDSDHPNVKNFDMDVTFQQLFIDVVENKIFAKLKSLPTKVVLVPSQRDVHHDYVYPQPAFSVTNKPENVYMAPDPATITLNGIVFGLTSTDVLPHIRSNEIANLPTGSDRLAILAKHLLHQRHYYPLYPPHESVNFDCQRSAEGCSMPVTPHVLVLPSNLKTFTKNLDGVVCVNPGRLSKGQGGGTYARLKLFPESNALSVADACVAQVVRI
ncbi:DNA polymerase alpha subunit B-like [Oscarella lobularis]|uniref:DNA polymerase alpha subunit B-like n=1 Tax=Oscarella lobularis TaxID=121494 RepID=UPI003313E156